MALCESFGRNYILLNFYKIIIATATAVAFVLYDLYFLESIDDIREFNVIFEFSFALLMLVLFLSIDSLKGKSFYWYLSIGFFLIYISMLVDGLDQFFFHPELYTAIFEKAILLVGFILVFFGVRNWIDDYAKLNKQLVKQAYTDELTGLYNRRGMLMKFEELDKNSQQTQKTLSFIIADLDDFKLFNDTMGHIGGDQFLAKLGNSLYNMVDENQVIGRWGGEEFAICMYGSDLNKSYLFAEKIRKVIGDISMPSEMGGKHVTVSLGISQKMPRESFLSALKRADRSLYVAKKKGKNQSVAS